MSDRIGVVDDGTVVGLREDYVAAEPRKQNRDGYQLFLANVLKTKLSSGAALQYAISFHQVAGRDVCRIRVEPAQEPVYVDGELYVRDGARKLKLSAQEAIKYVRQRWP